MMKRLLCAVLAAVMILCLLPITSIEAHAATEMKGSDKILSYLKTMEGFLAIPQWDIAQWTVGWGTKCPDEHLQRYLREGIPVDEAEALFREYIAIFEGYVNRFMRENGVTLNQNQFDALLSLSYNCGIAWMFSNSSLKNAIVSGYTGNKLIGTMSQYCTAGGQYLGGLMRRRLTEARIYLYGDYGTEIPDSYGYVFFDAGPGKASAVAQGYDCNMYSTPLVTATYSGYTFLGWYTSPEGGVKVTSLDEKLNNMTLYAQWEKGSGVASDPGATPIEALLVTVTGEMVNVRTGPGVNYAIVTSLQNGDQVAITEVTTTNGRLWGKFEKGWVCLEYTNFEEVASDGGFVDPNPPDEDKDPATFVVPMCATILGTDNLSVYNGPHNSYPVISSLKEGDQVLVVEMFNMLGQWWCRLESGGWIRLNAYVMLHDDQMLAHSVVVTVTNAYLNVRSEPDTEATWLSQLVRGNQVEILAVQIVNGTIWGRFSGGWISLGYTDFDASKLDQYRYHSYGDWYTVTASTCITNGTQRRDCKHCDHFETESMALAEHTFGDWYLSTEATCVAGGEERRDCKVCDAYETRATDLGDHSMGQWYQVKAPSCTEQGQERRDCKHCDYFETRQTEMLEHPYGQWYEVVAPGCETEGTSRRDCPVCGVKEEKTVPALGHSFGQWYETVAPTVDQYGQERRDCKRCDAFEERPVEPTEHVYGQWSVTLEPTCTTAGQERRDCTHCQHYQTRELEPIDHAMGDWTVQKAGSCVEKAVEVRVCQMCGHTETREGAYGEHAMDAWFMHLAPTCTEAGEVRRNCTNCGYWEAEAVSALGHSMQDWYTAKEPTCAEEGQRRRDCAQCDHYETESIAKVAHTMGQWYTVLAPTATEKGQERRDCAVCDYYETRETEPVVEVVTKVYGTLTGYDYLNIRASASTNSAKVGQLKKGDRVEILEQKTVGSVVWGRIAQGWIMITGYMTLETVQETVGHTHSMGQWYTVKEATATEKGLQRRDCACGYYETRETDPVTNVVTKVYGTLTGYDYLNIRASASASAAKVGQLKKGDRVEILEQKTVGGAVWGRIAQGWIMITGYMTLETVEEPAEHTHTMGQWETVKEATATEKGLQRRTCSQCGYTEERETDYVSAPEKKVYATITVAALNVRTGPGTNYAWAGQVYKGEVYEVYEQKTVGGAVWGRISKGWICLTGYASVREEAPEEQPQGKTMTVIANSLNIRAGAGTGYAIVGKLTYGAKVTVLEQIVVDGVAWARIEQGWVCMDYLK